MLLIVTLGGMDDQIANNIENEIGKTNLTSS